MKSKIINRVRERQEAVRSYHFWQGVEAAAEAEKARRISAEEWKAFERGRLLSLELRQSAKKWWQFWR